MTGTAHMDVLIATGNEGKIREIKQALHGLPLGFRLLNDFPGLRSVNEVGATYEENAKLKALDYSRQTRIFALAEDSGLEVDALGRLPGLHSARYGGVVMSDAARIERLLASLAGVEVSKRTARFVSFMVLAGPVRRRDDQQRVLSVTSGVCQGRIARAPRGPNGFGYDPVFVPEGYQETFGQLSEVIKNRISHRAQALLQMRLFLEAWMGKLDRLSNAS